MANKLVKLLSKALSASCLGLAILPMTALPSKAAPRTFYCATFQGNPTTMMRTPTREIPLVMWVNKNFGSEYQPEDRCGMVSYNFQYAKNQGWNVITTGGSNGYGIICATDIMNGECKQQLFTIPSNFSLEDSFETFQDIRTNRISAVFLNSPAVYNIYGNRGYLDLSQLRRGFNQ